MVYCTWDLSRVLHLISVLFIWQTLKTMFCARWCCAKCGLLRYLPSYYWSGLNYSQISRVTNHPTSGNNRFQCSNQQQPINLELFEGMLWRRYSKQPPSYTRRVNLLATGIFGRNHKSKHIRFIIQSSRWGTRCHVAPRWMPHELTYKMSILVQVMSSCRWQEAIIWANIDPDSCCNMASLSYNGMMLQKLYFRTVEMPSNTTSYAH